MDVAIHGAEEFGLVNWAPLPGFDEIRMAKFWEVVVVDDVSECST